MFKLPFHRSVAPLEKEIFMRFLALTSTGVLLIGSTLAFAADLPSRKEPAPSFIAPVPAFSWSGFYVGVNAGGFLSDSTIATAVGAAKVAGGGGAVAGGALGYNWDLRNGIVAGLEADLGYRGAMSFATPLTAVSQTTDGYLGTVRGRIGYSWDRFLVFATAGGSFGSTIAPRQLFIPSAGYFGVRSGNNGGTMFGWTAGAGAEYAVTNNWSVKGEYLYANLGKKTLAYVDPNGFVSGLVPTTTRAHVIRAGVNYHFN